MCVCVTIHTHAHAYRHTHHHHPTQQRTRPIAHTASTAAAPHYRHSEGARRPAPPSLDSPCECEHSNLDSLDARLFPFVVLAVAPAVTMDEASSLSRYHHREYASSSGHSRRDSSHHEGEQSPCRLALTRYWYYQYCLVYGIQKGGRGGVVYCPIAVQEHCNSVGNAGGRGNERMIDSCTNEWMYKNIL